MAHQSLHKAVAGACLALAMLSACSNDPSKGWSTAPVMASDARTIAVPVFNNTTYDKGIEVELTEAIIKELQRTTRLGIVRTGDADSTLVGSVMSSDLRRLTRDSLTGLTDELSLRITVDFTWRDARTGETIVARRGFTAVDTFVPGRGTGEPIEVGRRAAVQRLARDIVAEMRSSW